jgi:hypothetical protein
MPPYLTPMAGPEAETEDDEAAAGEEDGAESGAQDTPIDRLARSQRRAFLVVVALLVVVAGASIGQVVILQSRLDAIDSGVGRQVARATDDYARIRDQTAAMRAGVELLHRELDHVRSQTEQISRRLARQEER